MLLARKATNNRPEGMFVGNTIGNNYDVAWEYWPKVRLGRAPAWDWEAVVGMSRLNEYRNLSVAGATEQHRGFLHTLHEMVTDYPELLDYVCDFDGSVIPVSDLLHVDYTRPIVWENIMFLHGTSSVVVEQILEHGLVPQGAGRAVFGTTAGAAAVHPGRVYLTTQLGTAHFAAREAARVLGGKAIVLAVQGIREDADEGALFFPDEDSNEDTPEMSLQVLGSIAVMGDGPGDSILPEHIYMHSYLENGKWIMGYEPA